MRKSKAGREFVVRLLFAFVLAIGFASCSTDHALRFGSQSKLKFDPAQAWKPSALTPQLSQEFKAGGDTLSILNKVFQAKNKWLFVSIPFQADLGQLISIDTNTFGKVSQKTVQVNGVACEAILRKLADSWSYTLYFYESGSANPLKLDLRLPSEKEALVLFNQEPDFLSSSFE